jgi:hypothetical protein
MMRRLFFIAVIALITTTPGFAQDDDIDAQIKKAMEDANKPAAKKPDMEKMERETKAQIDQAEAENKAEEAKQKAVVARLTSSCLSCMCEHERHQAAISDGHTVNIVSTTALTGELFAVAHCQW